MYGPRCVHYFRDHGNFLACSMMRSQGFPSNVARPLARCDGVEATGNYVSAALGDSRTKLGELVLDYSLLGPGRVWSKTINYFVVYERTQPRHTSYSFLRIMMLLYMPISAS